MIKATHCNNYFDLPSYDRAYIYLLLRHDRYAFVKVV